MMRGSDISEGSRKTRGIALCAVDGLVVSELDPGEGVDRFIRGVG